MRVPTPFQFVTQPIQSSRGTRKNVAQERGTFWSMLQKSAQRFAGEIVQRVSAASPRGTTGSASVAKAPTAERPPQSQGAPKPTGKSPSIQKTEQGQSRVGTPLVEHKPEQQSVSIASPAAAAVTLSPLPSMRITKPADSVAAHSPSQTRPSSQPAVESPVNSARSALPATRTSGKTEMLPAAPRKEPFVSATPVRATTSAAVEPKTLSAANPQAAVEVPSLSRVIPSSSPPSVTLKNTSDTPRPAPRSPRDSSLPNIAPPTQANPTTARSAPLSAQTERSAAYTQPAADTPVRARAASSSSPAPVILNNAPATRRAAPRVLGDAVSPQDVPRTQVNQTTARSALSSSQTQRAVVNPQPTAPVTVQARASSSSSPAPVILNNAPVIQRAVPRALGAAISPNNLPLAQANQASARSGASPVQSQKSADAPSAREDSSPRIRQDPVVPARATRADATPASFAPVERPVLPEEVPRNAVAKDQPVVRRSVTAALPSAEFRPRVESTRARGITRPDDSRTLPTAHREAPSPQPTKPAARDNDAARKIESFWQRSLQNPGDSIAGRTASSKPETISQQRIAEGGASFHKPNAASVSGIPVSRPVMSETSVREADAPQTVKSAAPQRPLAHTTESRAAVPKSAPQVASVQGKTPVTTTAPSPPPAASRPIAPVVTREEVRSSQPQSPAQTPPVIREAAKAEAAIMSTAQPPKSFWGMKVVARPAQTAASPVTVSDTLLSKSESKPSVPAKPSTTQTTVTRLQATLSEIKPAPRAAVERELPRVITRQEIPSPPIASAAKPETADKTLPRIPVAKDSATAVRGQSRETIETPRAAAAPARTIRRDEAPIPSRDARTERRVPTETALPRRPVVFDATQKETKTIVPPPAAFAPPPSARAAGETRVLPSFDPPREHPSERFVAAQTARVVSPAVERRPRSESPVGPSLRAADAPKANDAPVLKSETVTSPRIQPPVPPPDSPLNVLPPATPAKPAEELAKNSSSSRSAPATDETVRTAAASRQSSGEQPTAAAVSGATTRETLARIEAAVPTPRTRLSVEQIRELQAMVSRALQTAQTRADGTAHATFNWAPEGFGFLRFSIVTRSDGVRIEIASNRRDVVEALEEGRAGVERMIADLGLRVERFEVRLRAPEFSDSLPQPQQDGRHPERNSNAEPGSSDAVPIEPSEEAARDEAAPVRRRSLAEHEWVA